MSQFDETTKAKADDKVSGPNCCISSFIQGRISAKESLEILANVVNRLKNESFYGQSHYGDWEGWIDEAIAQVKMREDWPLEGK